jgi:hypothetical protein
MVEGNARTYGRILAYCSKNLYMCAHCPQWLTNKLKYVILLLFKNVHLHNHD